MMFLKDAVPLRLECQVYREQEMPFAFDCPRPILERLPQTTDTGAVEWRAQCWQWIRSPLRDGDTIAYLVGVSGTVVPPGTPLRVEFCGNAPMFVALAGQRFQVPLWRMFPYIFILLQHVDWQRHRCSFGNIVCMSLKPEEFPSLVLFL